MFGHGIYHPGWSHDTMSAPSLDAPQTAPPRYPPAPDGYTLYLVGDIHGRLDLLLRVQRLIDDDKARNQYGRTLEIYLGDYIDRGPDSAGVVSRLITRADEVDAAFLRGNHEQLLLDFLHGSGSVEQWSGLGGTATLLSYGVAPRVLSREASADVIRSNLNKNLPHDHLRFYEQTGSYVRIGAYLAVHAGLRPGMRLEDQKTVDLLGIRHDFLDYEGDFGFIVIHGHTPVMAPDLRPNRINIDTGAFATNRLTCLRIGADGVCILQGDDRPGPDT
jgi:serine/threonine protein phosphatase 1